jgi:hypothetical protein
VLFRTFAGFHGLLCAQFYAILAQIFQTKQALSLQQGRRQDERPSMLFRTFAVYIKFRFTAKTVALTPLRAVYKTPFF